MKSISRNQNGPDSLFFCLRVPLHHPKDPPRYCIHFSGELQIRLLAAEPACYESKEMSDRGKNENLNRGVLQLKKEVIIHCDSP